MAGPTNPQTFTWDWPQTNADGTALTDLREGRVEVGPQAGTGPWSQVAIVASSSPDPPAAAKGSSNCTSWNLAPGDYAVRVKAVDTSGKEGAPSSTLPFVVVDMVAPGAPTNLLLA